MTFNGVCMDVMKENFVDTVDRLKIKRHRFAALAAAALTLTGCTLSADTDPSPSPTIQGPSPRTIGDCDPYEVFAQNRWSPQGAAVRAEPDIASAKVGSFGGNEVITVEGWRHTKPAYPTNPRLWQGDVWFTVSNPAPYFYKDNGDNIVWVNSAAVRAQPTEFDPTSRSRDGGKPVRTPEECELK